MSLCISPWISPVREFLHFLDLTISFLMLGKFPTIISSKICSYPFFFSSSSRTPIIQILVPFDIVPEVSETILCSFHSFYFSLLFRSYFHHFIFQLTDSFCFRYSAVDSFQSIFDFSNCVACLCMFILNSSRSLLTDSCIFSILLSMFLINYYHYSEFSGSLPILFPLPLFGLLCF